MAEGSLQLGIFSVSDITQDRVMSKLMLSSRAQAVVVAYESGLVVPGVAAD